MKKNEFRAVIKKHLHMKDLTPKEIKAELDNIHSTSVPAFETVYNWVNEFKHSRTSICDAPCSGRPIEAATSEIIDKVHDIVLTDRRVKEFASLTRAPMAKFNEFRYELLLHPAYSPDLASCDYFLFPNLKKWFGGKRFTREQLIAETETYFEGLDKSCYSDGLKKLENHWIKCNELKGDYVEK
ncbi:SETMR methyltransferase, partial [Acromyrmex heyeri]